MANINIFALGGQDENGKNNYVLEIENDIYVINSGIKVPINNRHGVDGIISDISYLQDRKERIKGLFLTHAHDEAFAALPWLLMDLPGITIYGSKFTLEVARERVSKYKINHQNFKFKEIGKELKLGNINIKSYEVANSIAGSRAYNFQTPDGDIVFLSSHTNTDLGIFGKTDLQKIKNEANDILALVIDSRRSNFGGKSAEKINVTPLIEERFANAKPNERIIVGGYDEEMYTLIEVMKLAQKYKRPIAIYGRAFNFLYQILKSENKPQFIDFKAINKTDNAVVLVTGTWSRLYQRFVRIATGKDVFLKLKPNDVIIQIAPPVNGLEVEGTVALDEVAKIASNITNISDTDYYPTRPTGIDIEEACKILKPKYFLPISGLYRYLVVATQHAIKAGVGKDKQIIMQNGRVVYFKNKKLASQKGKIKEYGDVIIDGFGVGDISYEVIRERQILGAGGLISIALQIKRKTKKPIGEMNVQLVGIAAKHELKDISDKVQSVVMQKIEDAEEWNYREIQNTIRKRVRKVVSKIINKEPMVVITFNEI